MSVSYDIFVEAFLAKVEELDFIAMDDFERNTIVNGYMKRAIAEFKHICSYDLSASADDIIRQFKIDIAEEDIDELADIISEGMLCQWMKPFVYKQENLESVLNTRDFTTYSPAGLLLRIKDTYDSAQKKFKNMMREYSYNHGDLSDLHL